VMVGDHRLSVDIITPDQDKTLDATRHNTLDSRIAARLLGLMMIGEYSAGAGGDDSLKLAKLVARGLETRRNSLADTIKRNLIKQTMLKNPQLSGDTELVFHPKRIALDLDPTMVTYLQDLRDRGDISRASILDEIGYDQEQEAQKREMEKERYDDIFAPVNVPWGTTLNVGENQLNNTGKGAPAGGPQGTNKPAIADPKTAGRKLGGRNVDSQTPNATPAHPRKGDSS